MDTLYKHIRIARRQLTLQRFVVLLPLFWCVGLVAALGAIIYQKLYPSGLDGLQWAGWWLGGSLAATTLVAALYAYFTRGNDLSAAIELDHRFGLKERISSSLSLSPEEINTPAGEAVVRDAIRRVERLDVSERFPVRAGRKMLLPILPAVIAFAVVYFVDERESSAVVDANSADEVEEQIKKSTEDLRKRIEERKKKAAAQGLEEVDDLFQKIDESLKDVENKTQGDRKKALAKLNNLADQLQERRKEVGGADAIQKQLEKMKDFQPGPADEMSKAMKQGDFKQAMDKFKDLQKKMKDGELSEKEKDQLAAQLNQMKDKLEQAAAENRQAMEDLEKQIDQAKQQGNIEQAGQLQQQLDKMQQQSQQNQQLDQLAQKLGQAADAMKNGDQQQLQQSLDDLQSQLSDLKQQQQQSDLLDQLDQEMQMAKGSMKCSDCSGGGCTSCQGGGDKPGQGQQAQAGGAGDKFQEGPPGNGLGPGRGQGDRPEAEDQVGVYDSKVDLQIGKGSAVVTGEAGGPNIKGQVKESIQTDFQQAGRTQADPLTGQRLPKAQKDHAREYFDMLREGTE